MDEIQKILNQPIQMNLHMAARVKMEILSEGQVEYIIFLIWEFT